ncbi:hypothetical protein Vretimale_16633 [Volvox reticuliferus]|uniref:Uncharacterized protein n=1 Tax=Volvox reticuliferus TaxID=1737510 RepID=A0A8J4LX04_9CHLO|nr:hypothetical protein Vretifemale_17454 [Volvox reticuliferus]GIM13542.1 hypothetical protein Vretimale_16633 [Volvox reticuliferus]
MGRSSLRGRGAPASVEITTLALALILLGISIHPVLAADNEDGSRFTTASTATAIGRSGHNPSHPGDGDDNSYGPGGGDPSYGPGGGDKSRGRDGKGRLPFRTGSIVMLVSPWLGYACDTVTDPAPYGPYGPGGDDSYSPDGDHGDSGDGWWAQRRAMRDVASNGNMGSNDKAMSYPYGPGDDDDLTKAVVWCNATITDDPPQPYLSGEASGGSGGLISSWLGPVWSALANGGAAAFSRGSTAQRVDDVKQLGSGDGGGGGGGGTVKGSQWDLDGFVLMGSDFNTPHVFSGGRVFLKNQNSRKFCRLADDDNDDGDFGLPSATVVCDEMTSSVKTEFAVEMVEAEAEEEAEAGRRQLVDSGAVQRDARKGYGPSGGDGDWPDGRDGGHGDRPDGGGPDSGDDSWPGHDGKKTSVVIRLRAPQNGMRYCGPDRRIRGSPIICDMRHPDTSHRRLTDFKFVDATPTRSSPSSSSPPRRLRRLTQA